MHVTNGVILKMIYGEGVELLGEKKKAAMGEECGNFTVPCCAQQHSNSNHFGALWWLSIIGKVRVAFVLRAVVIHFHKPEKIGAFLSCRRFQIKHRFPA